MKYSNDRLQEKNLKRFNKVIFQSISIVNFRKKIRKNKNREENVSYECYKLQL